MSIAHHTVRRGPSAAGRVLRVLRGLEHRLGADRPGRSGLVWLGPLISAVGAVVLLTLFGHIGGLGVEQSLPIGLFGGLVLGGLSVSYLAAFAADERDAEARERDQGSDSTS